MVVKQGWLKKSPTERGGEKKIGNIQKRWFVLCRGYIEYWTDPGKTTLKGTIELLAATEVDSCGHTNPRSFFLRNGYVVGPCVVVVVVIVVIVLVVVVGVAGDVAVVV